MIGASVSIIIPAHNAERYLRAALESVRAQTFTGWIAIVVNDGSTDGTAGMADAYLSDQRFQVSHQAQAGAAAARNAGLAAAIGEYVAFLDADDVWEPEFLATVLPTLQADPGAVAVFCGWQYLDAAGERLPQTVVLPAKAAQSLPEELTWRNALVPSGALVRRSALEQCGGFDPALAGTEDWDLWLRLAPLGRFIILPQALVLYRTHAENTSDKIEAMEANLLKLLQKHLGPLPVDLAAGSQTQRRAQSALFFNSALGYFRQRQTAPAQAKLAAALAAWPAYLTQDEFYYELACAYQPRGRRGQPGEPGLAAGAALLQAVVRDGDTPPASPAQRRAWWGHACLVIARLSADRPMKRRYAALAVWYSAPRHKTAALRTWLRAMLPAKPSP